jgi:hypothetical protein
MLTEPAGEAALAHAVCEGEATPEEEHDSPRELDRGLPVEAAPQRLPRPAAEGLRRRNEEQHAWASAVESQRLTRSRLHGAAP